MSSKTQLELTLEIVNDSHDGLKKIKMRKYLEANFIPQHGMEIVDSGVIFSVKTIALAGLSGLKHVAVPQQIAQNRHLNKYSRDADEKWINETMKTFKNQGWSVIE